METYGDNSTNCRTIYINLIEDNLKNFTLTGMRTGKLVLFALNEIQLLGLILTARFRLQE
jgi:hypothetical protein